MILLFIQVYNIIFLYSEPNYNPSNRTLLTNENLYGTYKRFDSLKK